MKTLQISDKYQLVVPRTARQTMHINKGRDVFRVKNVTEKEITFEKVASFEEFLGAFDSVFPDDTTQALRKMRDEE